MYGGNKRRESRDKQKNSWCGVRYITNETSVEETEARFRDHSYGIKEESMMFQ